MRKMFSLRVTASFDYGITSPDKRNSQGLLKKMNERLCKKHGNDGSKVYLYAEEKFQGYEEHMTAYTTTMQENAEDILAEAQQINEERAAQEAAAVQETEEDGADHSVEGKM